MSKYFKIKELYEYGYYEIEKHYEDGYFKMKKLYEQGYFATLKRNEIYNVNKVLSIFYNNNN